MLGCPDQCSEAGCECYSCQGLPCSPVFAIHSKAQPQAPNLKYNQKGSRVELNSAAFIELIRSVHSECSQSNPVSLCRYK